MGSWGYRTFEDDTACDWINAFKRKPSLKRVEEALDKALKQKFIDDLAAPNALAAAEVVAALNGKPDDSLPDEATAWIAAQSGIDEALLQKARDAVARVLKKSELTEIWEDSGSLDKWAAAVGELQSRLESAH